MGYIRLLVLCAMIIALPAHSAVTPQQLISTQPGAATSDDAFPDLATDGEGNVVAVWQSRLRTGSSYGDYDIYSAHSNDNGSTWSSPVMVNHYGAIDDADAKLTFPTFPPTPSSPPNNDRLPRLATDGAGNWVATWESAYDLDGTGDDYDIMVSRSTDNGASWSDATLLNDTGMGADGDDIHATVDTDRDGNWVVAWEGEAGIVGHGSDLEIYYSRSTDAGASWSPTGLLNSTALVDGSATDGQPSLSFGDGVWVTTWATPHNLDGDASADLDIVVSRSVDGALTWSDAALVGSTATIDKSSDDRVPKIATDKQGNWMIVWRSYYNLDNSGSDLDLFHSVSTDNGITWSNTGLTSAFAQVDGSANDYQPQIKTDGHGNWVCVWSVEYDLVNLEPKSGEYDNLITVSSDLGQTWSHPEFLNSNGGEDINSDSLPSITPDGDGNWIGTWYTNFNDESKNDVYATTFQIPITQEGEGEGVVEGEGDAEEGEGEGVIEGEGDAEEGEGEGIIEGDGEPVNDTEIRLNRVIDAPNGRYTEGTTLDIVVEFKRDGDGMAKPLTLTENLPAGWTFVDKVGGPRPPGMPAPGSESPLVFVWPEAWDFPYNFIYRVNVPAGTTGLQILSGFAEYVINDETRVTPVLHTCVFGNEPDEAIEGALDGEAIQPIDVPHSLDADANETIDLAELLRAVQLYNVGEFACDHDSTTEDGFATGEGDRVCRHHTADYLPADWSISMSELLRQLQFYNLGGVYPCPGAGTEDGYCAGAR